MAEGKWIIDRLGPGWWNRYTLPHPAPKSYAPAFARGGHVMGKTFFGLGGGFGVMGEAGAERVTIAPLSKDVATPHERRMEQFARQDQRLLERLVTAVENADGDVYIDGKPSSASSAKGLDRKARGERVAAGSSGWGR